MTWDESAHRRDGHGRFADKIDTWVQEISDVWGKNFDQRALVFEAGRDNVPEGHTEAGNRLRSLRQMPPHAHTAADRAEMRNLEEAFATYRQHLGLRPVKGGIGTYAFPGSPRRLYDEFGNLTDDNASYTDARPPSAAAGFRRAGDHPGAKGRVGGAASFRGRPSTHPEAGGLWIDPGNPGTRHSPRYLDDFGSTVTEVRPKTHPSEARKRHIGERRRGDLRGSAEGAEPSWRVPGGTGNVRTGVGWSGYGARIEAAESGDAAAFVARMKRLQPRIRQETARQPVRRTPRGTKIEDWMRG